MQERNSGSRTKVQSARKKKGYRSSIETMAAILRGASNNGGQSITLLRERSNLTSKRTRKYVDYMVERGLISVNTMEDNAKVYRPTEVGYEFLLKQRELVAPLDSSDEDDLFHFWE